MHRFQRSLAVLLAVASLTAAQLGASTTAATAVTAPDPVANDTVWTDTAGDPIRAQGGNVLKVGSTWYWVGANISSPLTLSTINLYSSPDLEHWTFVRAIVSQSGTTGDLAVGNWLGRPQLVHNPTTGKFVLIAEVPGGRTSSSGADLGNGTAVFSSSTIDGAYTYHGKQFPDGLTRGDASVFVEGANAYLVYVGDNTSTRNVSINVAPLSADWLTVLPHISSQWNGTYEAPGVAKVGATYYMFVSAKDWWNATATSYRTSTDLVTWSSWNTMPTEPASANSFATQFEQLIPVVGSAGTSYIASGDRYSQYYGSGVSAPGGIGRNAWYPVTFSSTGVPTLHGATDVDIDVTSGTLDWNEVANGRFDQDVPGTWIPQWTATGTAGAAKVESTPESTNRQLTIWASAAHNAWVAQNVTLPDGSYELTFDYRSNGGYNNAFFSVKNYGGGEIKTDLTTAASAWTTKTISFTVTTGAARIGVWADGAGGKWLNIDNVSIRRT
jgi:hypothetical protein